ncbi:MAG: YkgJ family cysteine cluster protein [Thermodesulfobacteriota bacterium]
MGDRDFSKFFHEYEALVATAEQAFDRVKREYAAEVACRQGCSDCCHALFDLSLIEAMYVNHHFNRLCTGDTRDQILEKANRADRKIYRIKKSAFDELQKGKDEVDILGAMSMERVRCPLLNDSELCDLYDFRPITCRLYGIPTSNADVSHTCGKTGFVQGRPYPTVKLDMIHQRLYDLSTQLVASIPTRFVKMADMLVPLSMSLLTVYDDEYLGISSPNPVEDDKEKQP